LKKVLFFSPGSELTGAPIFFLRLLQWINSNSDYSIDIITCKRDTLVSEFKKHATVYILEDYVNNWIDKYYIFRKLLKLFPIYKIKYEERLFQKLRNEQYSFIYANTIVSLKWIDYLKKYINAPIILYVHEQKMSIDKFIGNSEFKQNSTFVDHFIAASNKIAHQLETDYSIDSNKITTVNTFIDRIPIQPIDEILIKTKMELNIPLNSFVIVGSGTIDWRKGPDLFIQTAKKLININANKFFFIWVGGNTNLLEHKQLNYDIEMLHISNNVKFIGERKDPIPYFAISDIFFLSSREEPMGMVALEAAALHKPIMCFENIGGMPDFIGDNCGYVAPYLDIDYIVEKIILLSDNQELKKNLGDNAYQRINDYLIDIKAPEIISIFKKYN
jgi:glycosyltransferase involved in cell wall biosynthesis